MKYNFEIHIVDVINLIDDNAQSLRSSQKNERKRIVAYSLKNLEVKTKEPKQANQKNVKIMAFINTKKVEHEAKLDVVDL
jgi:hypothetical protein